MKLGTKSLLFGAHQFILHPMFVAIAWIKLFGFPKDPRVWVAFLVHDWGYWGKKDMDGEDGKTHPELGAQIMHALFDRWEKKTERKTVNIWDIADRSLSQGWRIEAMDKEDDPEGLIYYARHCSTRSNYWYNFTAFHSRSYAKMKDAEPSQLMIADKYVLAVEPAWLYVPRTVATKELFEYRREHDKKFPDEVTISHYEWYRMVQQWAKWYGEEYKHSIHEAPDLMNT